MKIKRKIYFVVGDPKFDPQSKHSAVSFYLNTLKNCLDSKSTEFINQPLLAPGKEKLSIVPPGKIISLFKYVLKKYFRFLYNSLMMFSYIRQQKKIKNNLLAIVNKNDIVVEFLTYASDIGITAKVQKNSQLIVIFDSPLNDQFIEMYKSSGFFSRRIRHCEQKSLQMADVVVCYSPLISAFLVKKGIPENKITVIPCIVWKEPVEHKYEKTFWVGFIGSFLSWHKTELLIQSFENIAGEFPHCKLVLIGKGEEWGKIERLKNKSIYNNRIVLTGFIEENELTFWKSKMSVGVMPGTNWYGSPLKLFEYAQAGIPVIAPNVPSVTTIFTHGETALLIDQAHPLKSIEDHIRNLILNDELRNRLAHRAKQLMIDKFDKDKILAKFAETVEFI